MPGVRRIKDGKYTDYGHDLKGAEMAAEIFRRWRFPAAFAKRVVWLVENHMRYHYLPMYLKRMWKVVKTACKRQTI